MSSRTSRRRLVGAALTALAVGLPLGLAQPSLAQTTVGQPTVGQSALTAPRDKLGAQASERPGQAVGRWTVAKTGPQTYRVTWRSPERLAVTSDRPAIAADGASLGPTVLSADGRTVAVDVRATSRPDPTTLDVLLSGDRLDETGDDVATALRAVASGGVTPSAAATRPTTELGVDPATPGPFDVVSSDYELEPVEQPGMPEPIEMVGHVVEPAADAATGDRPVVLFLHGRHSYCYQPGTDRDGWEWPCQAPFEEIPSHLGYDYIQQVLASQGYFTVSVRVNGINAQDFAVDDGGADARAAIVEQHLDYWAGQAADHQLDLDNVVLVGHSRGGEGVARASLETPLSAPYRIAGQLLLAPTDFGGQVSAYVPTVSVLPYCDGDVYDLQGQGFVDDARDLTRDDTSLKSSLLVMGANHNFFNTEWTPGLAQAPAWDDWGDTDGLCGTSTPERLTAAEQQSVGTAYVAGAVHLFADDEQEFLPMFDGSAVRVASTGDAVVQSHALGGQRDERRPGVDSGLSLPDGADTQLCLGAYSWSGTVPHRLCGRFGNLDGNVPHWSEQSSWLVKRKALEMTWTAAGQAGGLVFDDPLDLSGGSDRLELRTIVDPTIGDVSLHVRLVDAEGNSADLVPEGGADLPALPSQGFLGKRWAQPLLVDPGAAAGIDLSRIVEVDLVGQSDRGRVWVLDVAAAGDALAPVPAKRLPLVSLGTVRVTEGDKRNATARIPFTVSGTVTQRAHLEVGVLSYSTRSQRSTVPIDLAPGQTSGSVVVDYTGNRIDDQRALSFLAAFPRSNAMTDRYVARLVVVDDDPTPAVTVRGAPGRVAEGKPAAWTITLAKPVGYYLGIQATVVGGGVPGSKLQVGDVPRQWLKQHGVPPRVKDSTPLHKVRLGFYEDLRPGGKTATITIPTRKDGKREGAESVTLRFRIRMADGWVTADRTVRVTG